MSASYETHARGIRILPGQWRPHYPFEQIAWVSPPWPSQDYIWLDFPEAIFCDTGLLFLSHVNPHAPVLFPGLPKVAWLVIPGGLTYERRLPNGVQFGGTVMIEGEQAVSLLLYIENGTQEPLRNIKLQTCAYLRGIKEFSDFTVQNKLVHLPESGWQPFDAARASEREAGRFHLGWRGGPTSADLPVMITVSNIGERLVALTWYEDTYSLVSNPDIAPGQRAEIQGALIFFEGTADQFSDAFELQHKANRQTPVG